MGLGAPEMMIDGGRSPVPSAFLGGEHMDLDADEPSSDVE
jgi:hypothetical protein